MTESARCNLFLIEASTSLTGMLSITDKDEVDHSRWYQDLGHDVPQGSDKYCTLTRQPASESNGGRAQHSGLVFVSTASLFRSVYRSWRKGDENGELLAALPSCWTKHGMYAQPYGPVFLG